MSMKAVTGRASKYVLGVTGSIASGKTARCEKIAQLLSQKVERTRMINADVIGGQVRDAHADKVIAAFGNSIVDAQDKARINVPALAKLVFEPGEAGRKRLDTLNAIVWPPLKETIGREIDAAPDNSVMVLEAALLVEIGLVELCDEVWVVHASRATAQRRLMQRNNLSEEAANARVDAQMPWEERYAIVSAAVAENKGRWPTKYVECIDTSGYADLESGLKAIERENFPPLMEHVRTKLQMPQ